MILGRCQRLISWSTGFFWRQLNSFSQHSQHRSNYQQYSLTTLQKEWTIQGPLSLNITSKFNNKSHMEHMWPALQLQHHRSRDAFPHALMQSRYQSSSPPEYPSGRAVCHGPAELGVEPNDRVELRDESSYRCHI